MFAQARGEGVVLDQFGNSDNPLGHFNATGPELWEQTQGRITHFVSSMGTTGDLQHLSHISSQRYIIISVLPHDVMHGYAMRITLDICCAHLFWLVKGRLYCTSSGVYAVADMHWLSHAMPS